MDQRGFGGLTLYAALGVLVVIAGLGVAVTVYKNKAEAAEARVNDLTGQRDRAIAAARANEEAIKRLEKRRDELDKTLVEQKKRERSLEDQARTLRKELDEAKSKVSEADKACLDRGLPDPIASRLLDS